LIKELGLGFRGETYAGGNGRSVFGGAVEVVEEGGCSGNGNGVGGGGGASTNLFEFFFVFNFDLDLAWL
jgi:hypothetical protein